MNFDLQAEKRRMRSETAAALKTVYATGVKL